MIFKSVLGVYIGKSGFSAVWLRGTFGGVKPEFHLTADYEQEAGIQDRCEKAAGLIRDYIRDKGMGPVDVRLGISRELVILRWLQFPMAVKEDLKSTLTYEIERYVPLSVNDIVFDYRISGTDRKNKQLSVLLGVAKKEIVEPFSKLAQAILAGAESLEPGTAGLATVLAGERPVAGRDFVFACIDRQGIELGLVQEKHLVTSHYQQLAMDAVDTIGFTVQEGMGHISSRMPLKPDTPLLVCGSDITADTLQALKEKTGCQVEYIDFKDLGMSSFSQIRAHGIALAGVRNQPPIINLLPENQRKRTGKTGYYLLIILSVIALLAGASWAGSILLQKHLMDKRLDTELAGLESQIKALRTVISRTEKNEQKLEHINSLRKETVLMTEVLLEISSIIPASAWVEKFTYSKDEFRIEGYAESASDLLTTLESSALFKEVVFLSAITRRYDKERYRIGFKID